MDGISVQDKLRRLSECETWDIPTVGPHAFQRTPHLTTEERKRRKEKSKGLIFFLSFSLFPIVTDLHCCVVSVGIHVERRGGGKGCKGKG